MNRRATEPEYVLCVDSEGYRASLVVRRVYQRLRDPEAAKRGLLRVVDESNEDYLFPSELFVPIKLPKPVRKMLAVT